jgi:hypothetical protein
MIAQFAHKRHRMNDFDGKSIYRTAGTKGLCFLDALCRSSASMDRGKLAELKRKYALHLIAILKTVVGLDSSQESLEAVRQLETLLSKFLGE